MPASGDKQVVTFDANARVNLKAGELTPSGPDYVVTPSGSQPVNGNLTALAGLTGAADRVPYFTGLAAMALATFTSYGRSLVAAANAAAAKALLSLTKNDVGLANVDNTSDANKPVSTAQAAADALRVLKVGDTMTGDLILSAGKLLRLTGGAAGGQGVVRFEAVASGAYDTNLLHVDDKARTMGMIASNVTAFGGANGPYVCLRGNTYNAVAGQAGMLSLGAGDVAGNGSITFYTGNDVIRMKILRDGTILAIGPITASGNLKIGSSGTTLTQASVYTPTLTPTTSVPGNDCALESFTISGLATTDTVAVNPPSMVHGISIAWVRVSAANTLDIMWHNHKGGALTPSAGVYRILAIRS